MKLNIEKIARQAITRIKSEWGLPKRGLLAGGSLGNIMWEIVSGNKAVINDIDIFVLESEYEEVKSLFEHKETEDSYYEQYMGIGWITKTKDYYQIRESEKRDIFNTITYVSNTKEPSIVIKSFDINSTRIGYSIEKDEFYWTKDFEEFLKTGDLKVSTLITPAHTAIRLSKKHKELNANLDEFEYKLCQHGVEYKFSDIFRFRFKERYRKIYEDNFEALKKYFKMTEYFKKNYDSNDKIYELFSISDEHNDWTGGKKSIFNDDNLSLINNSKDFLFYMRNIYGDSEKSKIFSDLNLLFRTEDFLDKEVSESDIQLLSRLSKCAPSSVNNLNGYTLSEQIFIVKKVLNAYKHDPLVGISILESVKIEKDIEIDEQTSLILELSVRKKIINDTKNKVNKILYGEERI